ncbi:hypothetical protein ACJMK2_033609 [Sinanodonta woodiana]|uniref:Uncharacterized protein n=1 Tax=Sinanodonta woodiana TaxID=1069815 RepID=A0ABD3WQR4_SINWO
MLEMAHRLEGSQMSVMMWFRFHSVGGKVSTNATLLYITGNKGSIRYSQPSDDGFHVIVTVSGVIMGNGSTSTTLKLPDITTPSLLTNGNWHHFAFTISGKSASIVMDGIQTIAIANYSLDLNLNTQVFIGLMYTGEMSQMTVWNSALSYSDILRYYGNVSYVPNGIMAQGWWSYVFHPGVSRQYPSQLKCNICKPLQVDKTKMPSEVVCNKDPNVFTIPTITDRFVTLNAQEQQNIRNKVNTMGYNITSTLPQDATYPLGQYDAIFVTKDGSGNYQDCRFPIYVKYYDNCPLSNTDANLIRYMYNGTQVDSISAVKCTNASYEPAAALPRYIPCGVLGVFDANNPYMDKVLPSCGHKVMNNYRIDVQMQYQFQVQCIDLFLTAIITNTMKRFNDTTTNDIIHQFCNSSACSNVIVSGNCADVNALIAIQIYMNRAFISFGQVNYTLTEATRIIVLVERKFIFPFVAASKWLEDTVVISERKICNPGSSILGGACFECGKGMFSNNQTGLCEFCPFGTYQQSQGKESCLPCNSSLTTRNIGSMAATDCISICPKGQYYKYNVTTLMGSCQKCPRHFYQDEVGQSFCKPCPFQKVTADEGANSTTQCQASTELCASDDALKLYQNVMTHTQCPEGWEHTNLSCPAGTKGEPDGSCVKCETGTYQNQTGQTMCKLCIEPNSFTEQNGSTSMSQCKTLCDIQTDYCSGRGACIPSGQSATCNCNSGYIGSQCETRAGMCYCV